MKNDSNTVLTSNEQQHIIRTNDDVEMTRECSIRPKYISVFSLSL